MSVNPSYFWCSSEFIFFQPVYLYMVVLFKVHWIFIMLIIFLISPKHNTLRISPSLHLRKQAKGCSPQAKCHFKNGGVPAVCGWRRSGQPAPGAVGLWGCDGFNRAVLRLTRWEGMTNFHSSLGRKQGRRAAEGRGKESIKPVGKGV